MSRRTQAPKRELLPDPKHGSQRLTKFINMIMKDGKKSVAETIVYDALEQMADLNTDSKNAAARSKAASRSPGASEDQCRKPSSAAATALSISPAVPRGAVPITVPVAGERTSKTSPDSE